MQPTGTTRVRGFRAPSQDELDPAPQVPAPVATDDTRADDGGVRGQTAETLQAGPRARTRWIQLRRPGSGPARAASWRWFIGACAVLVLAVVVIAALAFRLGSTRAASTSAQSPTPSPAPATSATPLPTTQLYTQVVPSVVLITTSKGSLGSGTIITDTGTILTADHVISGGGTLSVLFADGTRSSATVASANVTTDTATIVPAKLPEVVVPATLGGGAVVGQNVVAMGNPLGLRDSTTTGIVSGVNRTDKTAAGTVTGLIQFDAAVNPGSSGGPLLDDKGNVIGVVLSIADPGKDDAFAGIGFAISLSSALGSGGDGPGQGAPQL